MTTHPKWRKRDRIVLFEGGRKGMYAVIGRMAGGYSLEPQLGGEPRPISDDEILEHRLDGNLEHYPVAPLGLSREQYELLSQDFDMHPEEYRLVAEIKADYLRAVDHHLERGHLRIDDACKRAATEVPAEMYERWNDVLTQIERNREADRRGTARLTEDIRDARRGDKKKLVRAYLEPKRWTTIQDWWRLWVHVGRDRKILIPLFADRGNRTPRLVGENGVDLYAQMRITLRDEYYTKECRKLTTAYKALRKALKPSGNGNAVSYNAFNDLRKREYGPFEELSRREGNRHARMRLDVARRIHYDMAAMQEIEIDHCLLDVMLVHERSGRLLGRPWLTMAMCRSTRMIVGVHISFDVPTTASVLRCLMHAFWPKDLRGLGLKNRWPCEGVPHVVISDNGKDLLSAALRSAQIALNFTMRYLPGRMPYLKGIIERCFGTLQIQVLDVVEGKAFLAMRKKSNYDPSAEAKVSLPQLRKMLLDWIVDDYHVAYHSGIGTTPLQRWDEKVDPDGVHAIERPDDLLAMLGSAHRLKIGENGLRAYGECYWHPELTSLRRTFGTDYMYDVRSDAYDIGSLVLIVPKSRIVAPGEKNDSGRRLEVFSTTPERSIGVSAFQNRVRRTFASKLEKAGVAVTHDLLDRARVMTDAQAQSIINQTGATTTARSVGRYEQDNGRHFTPVAGRTGSNRLAEAEQTDPTPLDTSAPKDAAPVTGASEPKPKPKRLKKVVKAPPTDAADDLTVDEDFEQRFAQMGTMD